MKRRWTCGVIAAIILALLIGLVAGTYLGWDRQFLSRYVPWLPYSPKAPTATGQPGPLHMTFTEADLTQQLHKSMQIGRAHV